jgi:hypothetical protein
VALVRTDVSEEFSASFIRMTRISELGTMLAVTNVVPSSPILVILMKEAIGSSETSVRTRTTWHNVPEDTILQIDYTFAFSNVAGTDKVFVALWFNHYVREHAETVYSNSLSLWQGNSETITSLRLIYLLSAIKLWQT